MMTPQETSFTLDNFSHANDSLPPIAIIGMGCRFPGEVSDVASFWKILQEGIDAVTEVPPQRWSKRQFYNSEPGKPGKTYSNFGGFLQNIDQFDPQFFGISPREAARIDPQQRMLLELTWEAMEDGGQTLERLSGSQTAVCVGISGWEYALQGMSFQDRGVIDVYSNTGGSLSIAANRISHCFDFRGPSYAVDTACSSSLVAVHLACQNIWFNNCPLAIAGGVSTILLPDGHLSFSRLNMLSPDGRCKAFDARGNGYVRSEGAGVVLLKPMSQALADGDRIYAVIRSAVANQDGRTPGITVPSQQAQEALLRDAFRKARVAPSQIQYVEAHGTGTQVGDPIEAQALGQVLGEGRAQDQPCVIGSVKTNIGHLETGSGMASLIKTALILHHRRIPKNLHFEKPNPNIDFAGLGLRVPVKNEPWPLKDGPALAGVNSFGYGGTNAHVVLQEAPKIDKTSQEQNQPECGFPVLIPLSTRGSEALRDLARALQQLIQNTLEQTSLTEIASNLAFRRSHHEYRLALVARTNEQLVKHLQVFLDNQPERDIVQGRAVHQKRPRIAFMCSGQGPQWWGMGRQLLQREPVFRTAMEQCAAIVRQLGPWSLLDELNADESHSRMDMTAISQPAIFALQVSLAALLRSWGVEPAALVGHSVGEVAAAYLAGVYTLEDATRIIYERGRCMELASPRGRMLAVNLSEADTQDLLANYDHSVALAAVNSPTSVTLSGASEILEEIAKSLEQKQVFHRFLHVSYAFHSVQMDPIREELLTALQGINPRRAKLPLYSTVLGHQVDGTELGPEYWWHNVRNTVRFADSLNEILDTGIDTMLELSPHPVLASMVAECSHARDEKVTVWHTLRRQEDEQTTMLRTLGDLYTRGCPIDWSGVLPKPQTFLRLPKYPWQRQYHWFESDESRYTRLADPAHPLLGTADGGPQPSWRNRLDLQLLPYLADHRVQGSVVVPATAYIEVAFAVAREESGDEACQINDFNLVAPCVMSTERSFRLQTQYQPEERKVQFYTQIIGGSQQWTTHGSAVIGPQATSAPRTLALDELKERCTEPFAGDDLYAYVPTLGLDYGASFRGIVHGWRMNGEAIGFVELPETTATDKSYIFPPTLFDACLHVTIPADPEYRDGNNKLYLPVEMDQIRLHKRPGRRLWCHVRLTEKSSQWCVGDIDIYNEYGHLAVEIQGCRSKFVAGQSLEEIADSLLYTYQWQPQPLSVASDNVHYSDNGAPTKEGPWLIFSDDGSVGERLAATLRSRGDRCLLVGTGTEFSDHEQDEYRIDPANREHMCQLLRSIRGKEKGCRGIVHLWSLDAPVGADLTTENLAKSTEIGVLSILHFVQGWEEAVAGWKSRLLLVTRGAQPFDEPSEAVAVAQSPVIGLGRVIISEYPKLDCKLVDLPTAAEELDGLLGELDGEDGEDEIAWRAGSRYAHRFQPFTREAAHVQRAATETSYRLTTNCPGTLDGLSFQVLQRQPPGPNQVEISVRATALNFSDVLKALGLYPGLTPGHLPLGAECSGIITAVGADVTDFRVGDEVLAVAPHAFASHVVTHFDLVALKPSQLSFEEAATIPIAFLTAYYGLCHLGNLKSKERVLIHSASGGVGLAAVQLAQRLGAEIFATAGTPEKRAFLKDMEIEHVMDSRSLAFADDVLYQTDGAGVDLILNSLAGEAIARGLETLAENGRFVEIGKRDIYQNTRIGLRPFQKNLAFFAVDLDRTMRDKPSLLGKQLQTVITELREGRLSALPRQVFPYSEVLSAFRHMQQAKHIGKIILTAAEPPAIIHPNVDESMTFRQDASYLVTGGLGGFGLAAAHWLAEKGARHLVLMGRRGIHSSAVEHKVKCIKEVGAEVIVIQADVSKEEDVSRALAEIKNTLPPLRGVFHAAMVLEDCLLLNLDRSWMERIMAPKVHGAWNLHRETLTCPLDYFVLFSSLSSIFGHAGQGNYAAANSFLDALAHYRRAKKLPATTFNWGYLGEVGYLSERQDLGERLQRQGVQSFSIKEALTCLERALKQKLAQISVMRLDWTRWRGLGTSGNVSKRFAHLLKEVGTTANGQHSAASFGALRTAAPEERGQIIEDLLMDKVAHILGVSSEKLDTEISLINLGFDSLMGVELRNWLEAELQLAVPIVELMRNPCLSHIRNLLCQEFVRLDNASQEPLPEGDSIIAPSNQQDVATPELDVDEVLANMDQLSSQEVDTLLATLMEERKQQETTDPRQSEY